MAERKQIPVIIDCDPGVDDAAALLLAFQAPELDVRAITTVCGNVELDKTTANALRLLDLIGTDTPVYRGAERPLFRDLYTAADVHGADGLRGCYLPDTNRKTASLAAWDAIYNEAVALQGELQIIAVGPLTNLAIALGKYPSLPQLIKRIVVMGGSTKFGNTTPAAEFNIYADPEAADMVFRGGIPLFICGLDVTHQSTMTAEEIDEVEALGTPQAKFFAQVARCGLNWAVRYHVDGAPLHDPCAVLFSADDSYFTSKPCWVRVETKGAITCGKTVTDLYSDAKKEPNANMVLGVNRSAFVARIMELMKKY